REPRRLSLPGRDGARAAQAADRRRVALGEEVRGGLRATRRRESRDMAEVLVGERHAVQRAARPPARQLLVEAARGAERPLGIDGDEGADLAVDAADPLETLGDHLDRRGLA